MGKSPTILETMVAVFSIFVFVYRLIVLMFPMFIEGVKQQNYTKIFNSLTMLV